jgi:hypothetical protein
VRRQTSTTTKKIDKFQSTWDLYKPPAKNKTTLMKQLFTLSFTFWTIFGFSQNNPSNQLTNFVRESYKLQYPASWAIDTSKKMGADFFILSPRENDTDKFQENVNLLVQDLTGQNIDLDKYAEITERQIREMAIEGTIYESKKIIKPDKSEYYKMVYGMTQGIFKLKVEQYYFIKKDKAFIMTFTAESSKFDSFQSAGEQILNSFVLTK